MCSLFFLYCKAIRIWLQVGAFVMEDAFSRFIKGVFMKIDLDLNNQALKEYNSKIEIPTHSNTERVSAVRFDKAGLNSYGNAYSSHTKTKEDIMKMAEETDVETARKYMTVLSNTMSEEDYKKAMEEGFDPGEMSGEEAVTIVDHIKAVMAESGKIIAGYNDDLSGDKLKALSSSVSDANALRNKMEEADVPATEENLKQIKEVLEMMQGIDELPEGSIKYMVDNDLEPTIENIYTSRFSAFDDGNRQARGYYSEEAGGYYAKKADKLDWESMLPQVEKAVEKMDLSDMGEEEAIDMSKWLLTKGIPVTEEKISELGQIRSIEFPLSKEYIENAGIRAIGEGKKAKEANLAASYKTDYAEAKELLNNIGEIRNREETRLIMTLDAGMRLIKQGVRPDTKELSELVEELKAKEQEIMKLYFGDENAEEIEKKATLFEKTVETVNEIPSLPLSTLGRFGIQGQVFSLEDVKNEGNALKAKYENAGQKYEELMTAPRRDMGDSIQKAFRNVDAILEDLRLETSEENRRAVRILGYNSMTINIDEINRVKEADYKLQTVIEKLTPANTLRLIREGINPLIENLDDLNEKISEFEEDPAVKNEKFSKFLYKLEQSNEISSEERESYIGIYRMINQIERTGFASVGSLLNSGVDLTFGNLLTSVRNSKVKINAKIDDDFGLLTEKIEKGRSITDQIETAFAAHIGDAAEKLETRYQKEKLDSLRNVAGDYNPETVAELISDNIKASANNIEAMEQFISYPNEFYKAMKTFAKRVDERRESGKTAEYRLDRAMEDFKESFESEESAKEGYKELQNVMKDTLADMTAYGADNLIDLKTIGLMHKQLNLATQMSAEENYHVPVVLDGVITDINVKLVHGEEKGLSLVNFETEKYGKIRAEIRLEKDSSEIIIINDKAETEEKLRAIGEKFSDKLESEGYKTREVKFVKGNPASGNKYSPKKADNNNEAVETADLYKAAKLFIEAVTVA